MPKEERIAARKALNDAKPAATNQQAGESSKSVITQTGPSSSKTTNSQAGDTSSKNGLTVMDDIEDKLLFEETEARKKRLAEQYKAERAKMLRTRPEVAPSHRVCTDQDVVTTHDVSTTQDVSAFQRVVASPNGVPSHGVGAAHNLFPLLNHFN